MRSGFVSTERRKALRDRVGSPLIRGSSLRGLRFGCGLPVRVLVAACRGRVSLERGLIRARSSPTEVSEVIQSWASLSLSGSPIRGSWALCSRLGSEFAPLRGQVPLCTPVVGRRDRLCPLVQQGQQARTHGLSTAFYPKPGSFVIRSSASPGTPDLYCGNHAGQTPRVLWSIGYLARTDTGGRRSL